MKIWNYIRSPRYYSVTEFQTKNENEKWRMGLDLPTSKEAQTRQQKQTLERDPEINGWFFEIVIFWVLGCVCRM